MADDRKVFPLETVLALVTGKKDVNVQELAGFITGRSVTCAACAAAVGPFAAAWLARWYPKFMDMDWAEGQDWNAFVAKWRKALGDNVSLTPMDGRTKALAGEALDAMAEANAAATRQSEAVAKLEARVRELEPFEARAEAVQKKCDELEGKLKAMKTEVGGLTRQVAEFQGKVAVNHDELMQTIKDAIKDGLKGMVVGGAAAAAGTGGETVAEVQEEAASSVPEEFGFGTSGANADGFGF
ncbi:MAG: hypothetical protein K2J64_04805 [Desulfovibrio sp.]|nr:hypothetical protein [Desulfovibrio sp.]